MRTRSPYQNSNNSIVKFLLMGLVSLVFGLLFLIVSLPLVQLVVMNPREPLNKNTLGF